MQAHDEVQILHYGQPTVEAAQPLEIGPPAEQILVPKHGPQPPASQKAGMSFV